MSAQADDRRSDLTSLPGFPRLRPGRVALGFGSVAGLLLIIHLLLQTWHHFGGGIDPLVLDRFNVDVEASFPTWYSASALLVCATLLAFIARQERGRRFVGHWRGLAALFLALSAEEIAGVHEALNTVLPIRWTAPGAIVAVVIGLVYFRFLGELPRRIRTLFVMSGAIYVGGALGIEQAVGWFGGAPDLESFRYALWTGVEEGAEMGGTVLFLYSLLVYLQSCPGKPTPGARS